MRSKCLQELNYEKQMLKLAAKMARVAGMLISAKGGVEILKNGGDINLDGLQSIIQEAYDLMDITYRTITKEADGG